MSGVNSSLEAVVISGGLLTKDAALAFLLIENLGQKRVSVFMDSLNKWNRPGFTLTKDSTVTGTKKIPNLLSIPLMTYPGELRKNVIITDLKDASESFPRVIIASGKEMPSGIPDGKVVHIRYTDLLNAEGAPKAAKDIWKILASAGVPRYADIVCFSDDPGEAAVTYFVLRLMGFPDVKVLVN
jgi:3-mercaptopyruvate sulfurtransferase SseA